MSEGIVLDCPYCGGKARRSTSRIIYGRDGYPDAYICENWPECRAYVGVHKESGHSNSGKPLGTLADDRLRRLRNKVHSLFDPLWKKRGANRKNAYAALANELGIAVEDCHVAMFDDAVCKRAIELLEGGVVSERLRSKV